MFNIEDALIFYKHLSEFKLNIIRSHRWVKYKDIKYGQTHCIKCDVMFINLLHYNINLNGLCINELTCNEIVIKKLLE
jgi:hypothetical protein